MVDLHVLVDSSSTVLYIYISTVVHVLLYMYLVWIKTPIFSLGGTAGGQQTIQQMYMYIPVVGSYLGGTGVHIPAYYTTSYRYYPDPY